MEDIKELSTYKEKDKDTVRKLCIDKNKKIIEFDELYAVENILVELERLQKENKELISEKGKNAEEYLKLHDDYQQLKVVVENIDKVVLSGMPNKFKFVLMRKEDFLRNFENTYIDKQVIRAIRDKAECMDYYGLVDVIDDLEKVLNEGE